MMDLCIQLNDSNPSTNMQGSAVRSKLETSSSQLKYSPTFLVINVI